MASRAQACAAMAPRPHAHHRFERTPGAASRPLPAGYRPRRPQATALYAIVAADLETMLAEARARSPHGFGLPRHVEATFRRYLDCSRLERGFARVRCPSCRFELLVPWACKTRGLCASCDGRRMTETAAHLVDHVLPAPPGYRQWTLSLPRHLRFRLLRDPRLASAVLGAFVRVVLAYHRRRARGAGVRGGHAGACAVPQRFGSFGNANWHAHVVIPDGVFAETPEGGVTFHALPPPTDGEVAALAARIVRRTARVLARADAAAGDDEPPDALAHAQADAVQLPLALAARPDELAPPRGRALCALVDGFSLHAATFVPPGDTAGLERLLRYILRPGVCPERISRRDDGRVVLAFRKPNPSGRTAWITDGVTLLRRLAALIPPRRIHGVTYYGVFGSAHRLRRRVLPTPRAVDHDGAAQDEHAARPMSAATRLRWSALLERVFGAEVTSCPRCGDRLELLAFLTDPAVTAPILAHLDLATHAPALAAARAPPGLPFDDLAPP